MSRKGENIYKRKDGRWEGRYIKDRTNTGKAKYGYVYAKSYAEAKKKKEDALYNKKQMENVSVEETKVNSSFETIALQWVTVMQTKVKESTNVKYQNILSSYLLPLFKTKSLVQITNDTVEKFCNELLLYGGKKRKGLSSKTVQCILSVLQSILKFAKKTGNKIVYDGIILPTKNNIKETKVLSHKEQGKLCQYLLTHLDGRNLGILVSLFTGIRLGELCALRWEDISFNEKIIYVHQTMQRIQDKSNMKKKTKIIITTPKSNCSIRTIPIPDELIKIMKTVSISHEGYFLTGNKEKFIEPRTMQNHFKKVLNRSFLNDMNYHCLRHTFATRCVELAFDIKSLSEILGHTNVNITMNRYVHPSLTLKREHMQKLSYLFAVK